MDPLLLTTLGVSAATLIGALLGLVLRSCSELLRRCLIAASAGIMLHSVMYGLIEPALTLAHPLRLFLLLPGLLLGFLFLSAIRLLSPRLFGLSQRSRKTTSLLFLLAMGIHHIPEGIAAGVSFGTGDIADVVTVAGGIALQNIPEGMVLIAPLLSLGVSKGRALLISLGIAILEALGVIAGRFAVAFSTGVLPLALGFAAGTMLYVILTDMVPDSCPASDSQKPIYCALSGFCMMTLLASLL